MVKVISISIHFKISNPLLTQFSKIFIVFLLGHCALECFANFAYVPFFCLFYKMIPSVLSVTLTNVQTDTKER